VLGIRYGELGESGYSGLSGYSGVSGQFGYSGYSGPGDHAALSNLDYANAGHSGFQKMLIWEPSYKAYLINNS
jgi:hypothetical protein